MLQVTEKRLKFPGKTRRLSLELPWLRKDEPHSLCREIHVYIHRTLGPSRVTLTLLPQKSTPESQTPLSGVTMPTTIYSTALQSTPKQLCLNIFHYIVTGCNPRSFYSSVLPNTIHSTNPYVTTISLTTQFIASCLAFPLRQSQPGCPPHSFRYQLLRAYTMEETHPFVLNKKIQISLLLCQICRVW